MPVITLTMRKGRSADEKRALLDAIHAAFMESFGVPAHERVHRIFELDEVDFYLSDNKSERFIMIELTAATGRTLDEKRELCRCITDNLAPLGIRDDDLYIILYEADRTNWCVRQGKPISDL